VKGKLMLILGCTFVVLSASFGATYACEIHMRETIHTNFFFPLDFHRYDYASIMDFYYGRWPDSFWGGVFIGTHDCYPDSLSWAHTLPDNFSVPPTIITRAKLWIDAFFVNTDSNTVEIEGTFDWPPLNHGCLDNTTYDLGGIDIAGFWNDGFINVTVRAGEEKIRLDEAKLLIDYESGHTDVEEDETASHIEGFELSQNYPNPFNPETQVSFSLPEEAKVSLAVYNVSGQKVRTLLDSGLPAGSYTVTWDGKDNQGISVASGVYFCRLQAGEKVSTKKMTLVR
jgi:hypothetical protein